MCNKYHSLYTHQSINVSIMSDFSFFLILVTWKKYLWNIVIGKTWNGTIKVEHKIFILILSSSFFKSFKYARREKIYLKQNFYIKK